ncbi:hypothetical protein CGZ94_20160 [Enemella evansiae]|uniref:Uncharacterized protein n=1 Tax=Enemella evansiae TaxID=2016499 RepID=A0A255FZZ8_9ACTN|nr:M23 family metallopeptidase [Enemella evansiae]OYO08812.1 hypothetical protein CGZ94_20160 [Enemella evansiae]
MPDFGKAMQIASSPLKSRTVQRMLIVTVALVMLLGAAVVASPLLVGTMSAARQQQTPTGAGDCGPGQLQPTTTTVSDASLTRDQVAQAQIIWSVARQLQLPDTAAVVGIATAKQESDLGADPTAQKPNGDGDAGVLQQRTFLGWYAPGTSRDENLRFLLDASNAARVFFLGATVETPAYQAARAAGTEPAGPVGYHIPGLVNITGWESMPVTQAAQKVQRSAFPDAYARWEPLARSLVQRFSAESGDKPAPVAGAMLCGTGQAMDCPPSGMASENGLTPDALRVLRCIKQQFPQISTIGGVGDRPSNVDDDHQTGKAVDVMIPGRCDALGDQVRDFAFAKQKELGVKYIIWCDKIWSVARNAEGWRPYGNPNGGDDTSAHRDHVHVSVQGNAATGAAGGTPAGGGGPVVLPLEKYTTTARFGQCSRLWRACHTGLDFANGIGTPIRSVADGTVTFAGWGGAFGNLTRIEVSPGVELWYAHQSAQMVTVGQRVTAGQQIGLVGKTGNVTGPHLHLEVRQNGTPKDPDTWLSQQGVKP